jgi:hypothetical protein
MQRPDRHKTLQRDPKYSTSSVQITYHYLILMTEAILMTLRFTIISYYLVPGHYYLPESKKRHCYSRIMKFVIAIVDLSNMSRNTYEDDSGLAAGVYTKTYISLYLCSPLNDIQAPIVSIFLLSYSHLPSSSSSHACSARERVRRPKMGGTTVSRGARAAS